MANNHNNRNVYDHSNDVLITKSIQNDHDDDDDSYNDNNNNDLIANNNEGNHYNQGGNYRNKSHLHQRYSAMKLILLSNVMFVTGSLFYGMSSLTDLKRALTIQQKHQNNSNEDNNNRRQRVLISYHEEEEDTRRWSFPGSVMRTLPEESRRNSKIITSDDYKWAELPTDLSMAGAVLGYDEKIWNQKLDPFSFYFDWEHLTDTEQLAATTLGYTKEIWDNKAKPLKQQGPVVVAPPSSTTSPEAAVDGVTIMTNQQKGISSFSVVGQNNKNNNNNWYYYSDELWSELPSYIQEAAKVLGYNENMWNNKNSNDIDVGKFYWNELSFNQKRAAFILGYTEVTWNAKYHHHTNSFDDNNNDVGSSSPSSIFAIKKGTINTNGANDDDDDNNNEYYFMIIRYNIMLASFCYVCTGFIYWILSKETTRNFLIVGGLLGLMSSLLSLSSVIGGGDAGSREEDYGNNNPPTQIYIYMILHSLSMHCFLYDACFVILGEQRNSGSSSNSSSITNHPSGRILASFSTTWYMIHNILFMIGALIYAILSWVSLLFMMINNIEASSSVTFAIFGLLAAMNWIVASIISFCATIIIIIFGVRVKQHLQLDDKNNYTTTLEEPIVRKKTTGMISKPDIVLDYDKVMKRRGPPILLEV